MKTIKERYELLCQRANRPMAILLLHGRTEPTAAMNDWGFTDGALFVDWVHITYNCEIILGFDEYETMPGRHDLVWFEKDLLAVNDGTEVHYFGDWEIVPAAEAII